MKLPKVKLCWNRSSVPAEWRLGLFGGYARSPGGRRIGWVISLRGALAWLAGLAVAGYFTGALALWVALERRPYNFVTYTDLVLPTRWSGVAQLRGKAQIAEGLDDIKAKRWGAGLAKLRNGIARYPEEIEGRLVLADLYLAMKARKQALAVYEGGLKTRYPGREYVAKVVQVAAQAEDFGSWVRTCDQALALLAGQPSLAEDRRWLIQEKLRALIAAERAEEALALAEAEGESRNPAISELRVLALLAAHKPAEAVGFLQAWAERNGPKPDAQILRLQVRAYREAGERAAMGQALETLRQLAPTDPRPYVYGIVQRLLAGQRDEAQKSLESFYLRFGSTPQYLQILAAPLAEIAERELLEQLIAFARQQGFALTALRHALVQALIGRGDWRDAAAVLAELAAVAQKDPAATAWYELMNAQVNAALDPSEGTQSTLVSMVRGRQYSLGFYKGLIRNLQKAGRVATAREVVTFAQGVFAQNAAIEALRTELDGALAAEAARKDQTDQQAAETRRLAREQVQAATQAAVQAQAEAHARLPAGGVAVAAAGTPGAPASPGPASATAPATAPAPAVVRVEWAEADFFAHLASLNQPADHAGALQAIRDLRRAQPAWLSRREAELALAEVRLLGAGGDTLGLRTAVRRYLTGEKLRGTQLLDAARDWHGAGRKDEALLVLREVVAKMPDYRFAQTLLAEWTAKPSAQLMPNAVKVE